MKVFLSHSLADKKLIQELKTNCTKQGLQLLIAEHVMDLQKSITQKIELMIQESAVALFLLTQKGDDSKFVHQEIGYAKSLKKPALYIVQKGKEVTGFAYGNDFIELDPENPGIAITKAVNRLSRHWEKINQIEDERKNAGIFIVGLIGLALLANSK